CRGDKPPAADSPSVVIPRNGPRWCTRCSRSSPAGCSRACRSSNASAAASPEALPPAANDRRLAPDRCPVVAVAPEVCQNRGMQLPPLQVTRAVIQRYARVLARYGDELGQRPLVLPNGDFLPDRFEGDQASLERLVSRLQEHAGMADIPIQATVIPRDADAAPKGGGCSSGACHVPSSTGTGIPRLVDLGDGWVVQVPEQELSHPVALTTNLSRSLAYVFLVETQHEGEIIEPPVDVTADFVAVALGLGALMMQGAYIYAKSCGGPSIASVTKVGVGELAVAFAAFI